MSETLSWLGRLVVLTLSLLATLSIIGSIAAIPSGSVEGRLGIERPRPESVPIPAEDPLAYEAPNESDAEPATSGIAETVKGSPIGAPPERDSDLRWLEPLTYAVIALAGLMALAVLFLWQAVAALNRIERR